MPRALITGGAGFFGDILKHHLLEKGWDCVSVDLEKDAFTHPRFTSIQGDIRNETLMRTVMKEKPFDVVFHIAAQLAHAVKDTDLLWTSNVDGTRVVAQAAADAGVKQFVFTSSNCLWGSAFDHPVGEDEPPKPVEIYGRSKWEGEKILQEFTDRMNVVVFRCPTIMDSGRLGLLSILFEFIDEGRKVWVVGGGDNRYQFIYAKDLADACERAATYPYSAVMNIGSDDVRSFRDVYAAVIERAKSGSRVARLPRGPTILAMKAAYALGLSPLGPYQYKMIAESFSFDTTRIKRELGWRPTLTNEEMLWKAYEYYHAHRKEIESRTDVSAHKQAAKMGVIRLLKWLS